ncbi:hypothetical protein AAY23_107016 [Frankia casuarinae]|nr:hypothetical protein BMG523Draft_03268 [Frankia sp. BMG5.23]OAA21817.1 hypothetical protein AAY23_107016 [Frankia casuarinae]
MVGFDGGCGRARFLDGGPPTPANKMDADHFPW